MRKELVDGIRDSIPIVLGYIPLRFAFGVLAGESGLKVFEASLMSVLCFTGAGQYVAIGLLKSGATLYTIFLSTALVNLRYVLFASSLVPYIKGRIKPPIAGMLSYGITDETFTVAINRYKHTAATAWYMAGLNITSHISWISSTVLGIMIGTLLGDTNRLGLGFALPAMYISLLVLLIGKKNDVIVAVSSAIMCILIGWLFPGSLVNLSNIIIATVIGATIGVLFNDGN
jgi:4-azaleucine resistance transporter AzlC